MSAAANIHRNATQLINRFVNPDMSDFWLQKVNPIWSMQRPMGKIVEKNQIAQDVVSLKIKINTHVNVGTAGQHHPVIIECNGRRYERSYSLTKVDDAHVLLTVKKVQQGIVSTWLVDQAQCGNVIEFGQAFGDMYLKDSQSNVVLLAAGSGITPMYSLIESLNRGQGWSRHKVHLMYWVKHTEDAAFKAYFEQLATQQPQFSFEIFYTQQVTADARLNVEHANRLATIEQSTVYACGPSGFVATAAELFQQAAHFQSEAFSLSPTSQDAAGFVNIELSKSKQTLSIAKGQSILEALEQNNIRPTHGCRMGICNKCVCHKSQGATQNLLNASRNTEPNQMLKLCVNSAQSDLVIDL